MLQTLRPPSGRRPAAGGLLPEAGGQRRSEVRVEFWRRLHDARSSQRKRMPSSAPRKPAPRLRARPGRRGRAAERPPGCGGVCNWYEKCNIISQASASSCDDIVLDRHAKSFEKLQSRSRRVTKSAVRRGATACSIKRLSTTMRARGHEALQQEIGSAFHDNGADC